jgi:hypothetical protein
LNPHWCSRVASKAESDVLVSTGAFSADADIA